MRKCSFCEKKTSHPIVIGYEGIEIVSCDNITCLQFAYAKFRGITDYVFIEKIRQLFQKLYSALGKHTQP